MKVIVTALFDLKRDQWYGYNRSIEFYLTCFRNVLNINCDMIIFGDVNIPKLLDIVTEIRSKSSYKTYYYHTKLEDTYMWKYNNLLNDIQQDPNYAKDHPNKLAPEISQPLYCLLTCNKPFFMKQASVIHDYDHYIWMDAGYTHNTINIKQLDFQPNSILIDKITMIQLKDFNLIKSLDPIEFSNSYDSFIIGGFFCIPKTLMNDVVNKYYNVVDYQLRELRLKEDDQHYWLFVVLQNRDMFNLIKGDWYDGVFLK